MEKKMLIASLRCKLYPIIEPTSDKDSLGRAFNLFIIFLITLNCLAMGLETSPALKQRWGGLFRSLEIFSVAVFTLEYLLRLWTCIENPVTTRPIKGRLRHLLKPMVIIDLLAILPFYVATAGVDLRAIRAVRIFRVFRVLKLGSYTISARIFGSVMRARAPDLIIALFSAAIAVALASYAVFIAEHPKQPEVFVSLLDALWWAVAVLTPGAPPYDFAKPVTMFGKSLSVFIQVLGVGVIALPTGILGAGFVEEIKRFRAQNRVEEHEPHATNQTPRPELETLTSIEGRLDYLEGKVDHLTDLLTRAHLQGEQERQE